MIEVWMDEDDGEAFFCLAGMIDLHIRTGTVSKNVQKVMDLNTNNMTEAHKMFQKQLDDVEIDESSKEEGWD
jgi:hypothetical protein